MKRFRIALTVCTVALGLVLWVGGSSERRYVNTICQHFLINQDPFDIGIVTIGGSRILTATDADHFNEILDRSGVEHQAAVNIAHSHFTLAKEYTLVRDLLQNGWKPRSVLVMIEPRTGRYGAIHPEFAEIARVSDIPLSMRALWSENPWAAVAGAVQVLRHQFEVWERVRLPRGAQVRHELKNCHVGDYRLTLDQLARYQELSDRAARNGPLKWDIAGPKEAFTRTYVEAFLDLADAYDTQVIFHYLSRAGTTPPTQEFADVFYQTTGARLIVQPPELAAKIDRVGRRDGTHINAHGRETYLPWLIGEIQTNCENPRGCL